ncbi:hypothetical protein [uncultured Corynebacterium sp.]|uniref:hypothetical protein n=1 Tax=uncultured Corynebacterium sp. TaxID=159447 RepID=UPI00262BE08A|nr:hypothetical protein [uncultured Corynebacterium sp.]
MIPFLITWGAAILTAASFAGYAALALHRESGGPGPRAGATRRGMWLAAAVTLVTVAAVAALILRLAELS